VADCAKCHGEDIHKLVPGKEHAADAELVALAERVPELTARLETSEQSNKSLQRLTPVSLGLGVGAGGMLGIVFMLVMGYFAQRRSS
jgi:hypothetical protein